MTSGYGTAFSYRPENALAEAEFERSGSQMKISGSSSLSTCLRYVIAARAVIQTSWSPPGLPATGSTSFSPKVDAQITSHPMCSASDHSVASPVRGTRTPFRSRPAADEHGDRQ